MNNCLLIAILNVMQFSKLCWTEVTVEFLKWLITRYKVLEQDLVKHKIVTLTGQVFGK